MSGEREKKKAAARRQRIASDARAYNVLDNRARSADPAGIPEGRTMSTA